MSEPRQSSVAADRIAVALDGVYASPERFAKVALYLRSIADAGLNAGSAAHAEWAAWQVEHERHGQ